MIQKPWMPLPAGRTIRKSLHSQDPKYCLKEELDDFILLFSFSRWQLENCCCIRTTINNYLLLLKQTTSLYLLNSCRKYSDPPGLSTCFGAGTGFYVWVCEISWSQASCHMTWLVPGAFALHLVIKPARETLFPTLQKGQTISSRESGRTL